VPLSEEELRLLEQMERALVEEDPKFASTLRGSSQYDAETGLYSCDVRWDHAEDGLMGIWRVTCTAQDITEGKRRKNTGVVPEKVAEFIASRLGDSL